MIFPKNFIDEVRSRILVSSVVRKRVALKNKGQEFGGLCPFHNEKTPSFTVNDNKGFYHCFGCGAHGNVFDFIMQTEGASFPEAVERLALEAGLALPKADPFIAQKLDYESKLYNCVDEAAKFYYAQLRTSNGYKAREYLQKRGLKEQTIEEFKLGFAPDVPKMLVKHLESKNFTIKQMEEVGLIKNGYEMFRGRIIFPITDGKGRAIAFGGRILENGEPKYLNSPETPIFIKRKNLYGKAQAKKPVYESGKIIVCEGYMDVIALSNIGIKNAVAPLGTSLTEQHLEELWSMAAEPFICFDGDGAGQRAALRAANMALPALKPGKSLNFVMLPNGMDPDDIAKQNPAFFGSLANVATSLSAFVYDQEKIAKTITTPEQQAELKQRLTQKAAAIKDPEIAKNYLSYFNQKFWEEFKTKKSAPAPQTTNANVIQLANAKTTTNKLDEIQALILCVIAFEPEVLKDTSLEEEIANFDISHLEIDNLRQNILNASAYNKTDIAAALNSFGAAMPSFVKKAKEVASKQGGQQALQTLKGMYYLELEQQEIEQPNNSSEEEEFYRLQQLITAKQKLNASYND